MLTLLFLNIFETFKSNIETHTAGLDFGHNGQFSDSVWSVFGQHNNHYNCNLSVECIYILVKNTMYNNILCINWCIDFTLTPVWWIVLHFVLKFHPVPI